MTRYPVTVIIGTPTGGDHGHPYVGVQFVVVTPLAVVVQISGIGRDGAVHIGAADGTGTGPTLIGPTLEAITVERIEGACPRGRTHITDLAVLTTVDGFGVTFAAQFGKTPEHFQFRQTVFAVHAIDTGCFDIGRAVLGIHAENASVAVVPFVGNMQEQAAFIKLEDAQALVIVDLVDCLKFDVGTVSHLEQAAVDKLDLGIGGGPRFQEITRGRGQVANDLLFFIVFMGDEDVFIRVGEASVAFTAVVFGLVDFIDKNFFRLHPAEGRGEGD